uniref:Uncharacterized protein n=2 Tax=Meloidogyne TaxID=189290 RepID=A0A6V7W924_MELEN|nr:unnamed protein product [Meloidogyne enterolobii]
MAEVKSNTKKFSNSLVQNDQLRNKQITNFSSKTSQISKNNSNNLGFRYIWPVRVQLRQLGPNGENTILHISPKFATVHEHVSFQWTLKMHGIPERMKKKFSEERNVEENKINEEERGEEKEDEGEDEEEDDEDEEDEEESPSSAEKGYVAISLYYLDGPVNNICLKAQVHVLEEKELKLQRDFEEVHLEEKNCLTVTRGSECELALNDRNKVSNYIRQNIGKVIRLSLLIEMDLAHFCADTYLNAVSPTPIHSFLTANYRARVSSKVWRKCSNRRPRSASDGHHKMITGNRKLDLERSFNRVMDRERERRELERCYSNYGSRKGSRRHSQNEELILEEVSIINNIEGRNKEEKKEIKEITENEDRNNNLIKNTQIKQIKTISNQTLIIIPHHRATEQHLFKKLLVACCESCERRASLTLLVPNNYHQHNYGRKRNFSQSEEDCFNRSCSDCEMEREDNEDEEDIPFECDEENKAEIHDTLANMYFNKVVLPDMDYVEDFVDFLIDAELNDLPVLKRACERYLCGELNTKKELMTSLILDLFFIAMVFRLPVMKSMTLTELCDRYYEMEDLAILMEREEYKSLDKRIRQLCGDRNLADLVDECKRFREQCLRVQRVNFCSK